MYERIQEEQRQANLEQALEYTPEAFGRVVMLYVPAVVNKTKIAAFIDSGAQMTVMSLRVAEECGIARLIDKRFAGMAKGVGTSKIIGRVHMTLVTVGDTVMPMSITVLEQNDMDFLIGLDQLKRHQMCIDLKENVLRLGDSDATVKFMSEHELPPHIRGDDSGEAAAIEASKKEAAARQQQQNHPGRRLGNSTADADDNDASAPGNVAPQSTPQHMPSASPSPPPPVTQHQAQQSGIVESNVEFLIAASGATRAQAIAALQAAEGNADTALSILLGE